MPRVVLLLAVLCLGSDASCEQEHDFTSPLCRGADVEREQEEDLSALLQIRKREAQPIDSIQSVCGNAEETDNPTCLPESMLQQRKQSAATLMMSKVDRRSSCTGFVVKSPGERGALVLSVGHCANEGTRADPAPPFIGVTQRRFFFNYTRPCDELGQASADKNCIGTLVDFDYLPKPRDVYSLWELDTACPFAAEVEPIQLDVGVPPAGEGIYIIGHPAGRPQVISHEEPHAEGFHCVVQSVDLTDVGSANGRAEYVCDTLGGGSGSPVFSSRTGRAFAIHKAGPRSGCDDDKPNSGVMLQGIIDVLEKHGIGSVNRAPIQVQPFVQGDLCPGESVPLPGKNQFECENLCINSLSCSGYTNSASAGCSLAYDNENRIFPCRGDTHFHQRANGFWHPLRPTCPQAVKLTPLTDGVEEDLENKIGTPFVFFKAGQEEFDERPVYKNEEGKFLWYQDAEEDWFITNSSPSSPEQGTLARSTHDDAARCPTSAAGWEVRLVTRRRRTGTGTRRREAFSVDPLPCGNALTPVAVSVCPDEPKSMPNCEEVADGELCEGDGECGTDTDLNNCGPYDVYRRSG